MRISDIETIQISDSQKKGILVAVVVFQFFLISQLYSLPDLEGHTSDKLEDINMPHYARSSDHPRLSKELIPNKTAVADKENDVFNMTVIRINRRGWRDSVYSYESGNSVERIAAVGDSITFGLRVNHSDTYTEILERRLRKQGDSRYEFLNFGMPGSNARDKITIVNESVIKYDVDTVLLQLSGNDGINYTRIEKFRREFLRKYNETKTREEAEKLANKKAWEKETEKRKDMTAEKELRPVLNQLERLRKIQKREGFSVHVFIVRASSEKEEVVKGSIRGRDWKFQHINYTGLRIPKDGHPSPAGHRHIASRLLDRIS